MIDKSSIHEIKTTDEILLTAPRNVRICIEKGRQ